MFQLIFAHTEDIQAAAPANLPKEKRRKDKHFKALAYMQCAESKDKLLTQ